MEIYWLWLCHLKGIGPVTLRKLVDGLGSPKAVYKANRDELQGIPGLKAGIIELLLSRRSLDTAKRVQEKMRMFKIFPKPSEIL